MLLEEKRKQICKTNFNREYWIGYFNNLVIQQVKPNKDMNMMFKEQKQLQKIMEDIIRLSTLVGADPEPIPVVVSLDNIESLVDEISVYLKYLIFDLEATNRELNIAKNIIEEYKKNK